MYVNMHVSLTNEARKLILLEDHDYTILDGKVVGFEVLEKGSIRGVALLVSTVGNG